MEVIWHMKNNNKIKIGLHLACEKDTKGGHKFIIKLPDYSGIFCI